MKEKGREDKQMDNKENYKIKYKSQDNCNPLI
jgi:hypothetical protein